MPSSQTIAMVVALGLGPAFTPAAWVDHRPEACTALVDARVALWSMMDAKDKSTQDALNAKVQAASTKLDTVLASMTGAEAKKAAEFKAVWDQFKATRDNEIIPAVYAGKAADAKKIAASVQAGRLSKMWGIMSCKTR
jgi:acetylornithine/succinyldiaminopimelate/putrescine aminotransferase